MPLANAQRLRELEFFRAKASKYAFYGVLIASASVILAMALASYFSEGEITITGMRAAQATNIALWVLDAMPFIFAAWGQYASYKMADEANDIVEDKTYNLRTALSEIKFTSQAKSDFFSKMSHELRSPLNGVIGMVDLLSETKLDRDQRRYVSIIKSSSMGLLNLINDILDFSKIEAGKLILEKIEFDLRECIETSVTLFEQQARLKHLALTTLIEPRLPVALIGDPGRLRQVVINLISNAIKFTESGEVVLTVKLREETANKIKIQIEVADTGIGISQEAQRNLFLPYRQADAGIARKYGGTGLGLVISKDLVEAMGGEIAIRSEPDKGTTFWFTVVLEKQTSLIKPPCMQKINFNGVRVLLADENFTTRTATAQHLRSLGMAVEEVGDGIAALQMLLVALRTGYHFNLVITDMFLPYMNGEELGREIKSRDEIKELPLIIVTSVGQRGDAQQFNEIGFAAYLAKPIPPALLQQAIVAALATRHMTEEHRRQKGLITKYTFTEREKKTSQILVADDSAINREIVIRMLTKLGYTTATAENGQEAVALAKENKFALILMDLQMPVMDGLTAIAAIRGMPHQNQTPIIALSAGVSDAEKQRCLHRGANAVLIKPINITDFSQVIKRLTQDFAINIIPENQCDSMAVSTGPYPDKALISLFINETTHRLNTLRDGLKTGNQRRVALEAHTLKSTSGHFQVHDLRNAAQKLEQLANLGQLADGPALLNTIEQAFATFRANAKNI